MANRILVTMRDERNGESDSLVLCEKHAAPYTPDTLRNHTVTWAEADADIDCSTCVIQERNIPRSFGFGRVGIVWAFVLAFFLATSAQADDMTARLAELQAGAPSKAKVQVAPEMKRDTAVSTFIVRKVEPSVKTKTDEEIDAENLAEIEAAQRRQLAFDRDDLAAARAEAKESSEEGNPLTISSGSELQRFGGVKLRTKSKSRR